MNIVDFVLRYRLGEGEWKVFNFLKANTLIGRDDDNDLILDHREVSRHHLRIRLKDDVFQITDLESSNGTQLDGVFLDPQIPSCLQPGQIIKIGDFSIILEKSEKESLHISREMLPSLIRYRYLTGTWQTFPLEIGEKTIGRDPESDFHLNDVEVSRRHARLRIDDDGIWLTDIGSTNGTRINENKIEPHQEQQIQLGQSFTIGNFVLQVVEPSRFDPTPSVDVERPDWDVLPEPMDQIGSLQTVLKVDQTLSPLSAVNLTSRLRVTIGRSPDNDVVLKHPMVNRRHAAIEHLGTRFRIQDLRSNSGVFVNGKRIERETILKDWDRILIGPFEFVISGDDLQQQVVPGLKLEAQNIRQQRSRSQNLLQEIQLSIHHNELVAIVGKTGSGKTALLNALSGSQPASHGKVLINGIDLYEHYDYFCNDIGYVPIDDIVHLTLTPETALDYTAQLRLPSDISKKERRNLINEILGELDLSKMRSQRISHLSKEHIKCVSIGCELLSKPRLFFLDEPTNGLDPSAEYNLVRILRRLADLGKTVFFTTLANKNVMLCDKVIVLAKEGNLAFFGDPRDAIYYFDQYRTDSERNEKAMEIEDIYHILSDEARGIPSDWRERYFSSHAYQHVFKIEPRLTIIDPLGEHLPSLEAVQVKHTSQRVSGFHQFLILSSRNFKTLVQDRVSLALMLCLAPLLGLLDLIWGPNLHDPVSGDFRKIITVWFLSTIGTLMIGAFSSFREIVKEADIYKRERAVKLKLVPYIFAKVWLGVVLGLYHAGVLLIFKSLFANPSLPSLTVLLSLYFTFFLGIITGYLIGLLISALSANQNVAVVLTIITLVFQVILTGALLPLNWIPGGASISVVGPSRWIFESFVRVSELGEELTADPCWSGYEKSDRIKLSNDVKHVCPCMGASIFTDCADFPGILSMEIINETAQQSLGVPEPVEPLQPTPFVTLTALPSPTLLPTPTLLPSLTPYPTPRSVEVFPNYLAIFIDQTNEYQRLVSDQIEQHYLDQINQAEAYFAIRSAQRKEYSDLIATQNAEYIADVHTYSDRRATWQENRDRAIFNAEALLGSFFENYHQVFQGTLIGRWVILICIQILLFILIVLAQMKKD